MLVPFEIIALIIDIAGERKDTNLLQELSLVSYSFYQICSRHIFADVNLHNAYPKLQLASSKKGFVKLLKSRPDVVKHVRELTYTFGGNGILGIHSPTHPNVDISDDDHLLSPILPKLLRTISHLKCIRIRASAMDWNRMNSSLTSAFLHLMHLPTIIHIDLSYINNFPLSSLTPSVNLLWLDIFHLICDGPGEPEFVVQSEMIPKIREFHTSESPQLTRKLLHAKRQDGQPAFNFMDLRRLSISSIKNSDDSEEEQNIRDLLQKAKLLEKLHLTVGADQILVGLHDILSSTLKVLVLTVLYDDYNYAPLPLTRLYEELEAMAGRNMLETLSFKLQVDGDETEDTVGSILQGVEEVLFKPGWSALKRVSFKVTIICYRISREDGVKLFNVLQYLPDKYLSRLPKVESLDFNFSLESNF